MLAGRTAMHVCMYRFGFGGTSTCAAYTRTPAHGATPELRRVADTTTTSHGLSAGRHSTQNTIGSPIYGL